jgi:hypothetical protein
MLYLDCPAYLDEHGAVRCGLPATVEGSYTMSSSDRPLAAVRIRCPAGHFFNGPIELLTWEKNLDVTAEAARAGRSSVPAGAA